MKTYTYTYNELIDFIKSQKPDRLVDFTTKDVDSVGDLITHFGRHKLKKQLDTIGITRIMSKKKILSPVTTDFDALLKLHDKLLKHKPQTYKQITELI